LKSGFCIRGDIDEFDIPFRKWFTNFDSLGGGLGGDVLGFSRSVDVSPLCGRRGVKGERGGRSGSKESEKKCEGGKECERIRNYGLREL